jgi:hypothetical protein
MPKRINPQDQWETDFLVPLPGEPRNIGPLETLFQRLLNRTERLKNRVAAILGLPWDATPPDTLAGLAGRVSMLEANISVDPAPRTLPFRNAQGAVQDGATHNYFLVKKVAGIYAFGQNRWFRLATWSGFFGLYLGIFADLRIRQMSGVGAGRLRFRTAPGHAPDTFISVSNDTRYTSISDAIVKATSSGVYELWIHCSGDIHVEGVLGTITGTITLTPYGEVHALTQDTPPTQEPGQFYLRWQEAPMDLTFPGPGYIVAAGRSSTSGYIRYDNGVQICWASHDPGSFGGVVTGIDSNYKYRSKTWVFPAAFTTAPVVIASGDVLGGRVDVINVYEHTPIQCTLEAGQYNTNDVDVNTVYTFAIGRWK